MKLVGQIILVCLAIAALQVILGLLVVAVVVMFLWGLIFRTQATLGLVVAGLALGFALTHPFVFIGLLITLWAIESMASQRKG